MQASVALALQGGGAHGAFTWGVLDRLLEDGLRVDRVCGVSSGAIIGSMLTQGWGLFRQSTAGTAAASIPAGRIDPDPGTGRASTGRAVHADGNH